MKVLRRTVGAVTVLGISASMAVSGVMVAAADAAPATVSINAPIAPTAGRVTLTGNVGVGPGETTTVLYVIDATESTAEPRGSDCSGNGAVGAEDDLNGDGVPGDVLDCEIAGVLSLNDDLATTPGVQVGLVAFANQAAAADLDPVGSARLVAPGYTGGDPRPRIDTVARSVVRNKIGLYDPLPLGGSGAGTAFNSAIQTTLATLGSAPAGPKYVMFLSDGQSAIDDGLLDQLRSSGVRLRTFGIGVGATCAPSGSLAKMASATGERCVLAPTPAALAASLTGSEPDAVSGVTVSIQDVALAADLDAVGGWSVGFVLGAGTYTATVRAVLVSGATSRSRRTFTVGAAPGGPPPGTVAPAPGASKATAVKVARPAPSRAVLPSRVTGRVGLIGSRFRTSSKLVGSRVLLQARARAGDPWTTVDRGKVGRAGAFALTWKPQVRLALLRVELRPHRSFAASASAVRAAKISACKVSRRGAGWSLTCSTTARTGSRVRLLRDGRPIDASRVRDGILRLRGTGAVKACTVDVSLTARRHVRLDLG
jgi:hypothetical protein